jgi:hypothetical protein
MEKQLNKGLNPAAEQEQLAVFNETYAHFNKTIQQLNES